MVSDDRALVLGTWLPGYWRGASCPMKWCSLATFSVLYQPTVEELIRRSYVWVAVAPSDESLILGYTVVDGDMVHWCYVNPTYRQQGLLWFMLKNLADKPMQYTHSTLAWEQHVAPKLPRWRYRPGALRGVVRG